MTFNPILQTAPTFQTESGDDGATRAYIDWGPVLGGAFVAVAISSIMTVFGSAIGLSMTSAYPSQRAGGVAFAIAAGIWALWVAISGFAAGGYLAGRMRRRANDASESEVEMRDGANGLVVWAVGILFGAWLAASSLGVIGQAAVSAGSAALSAAPSMETADKLLRGNASAPAMDGAARMEVARILGTGVASGSLAPDDKAYLSQLVAARSGMPQADADKRVDAAATEAKKLADEARAVAESARRRSVIVAFLTAASLLLAGGAAWFAAVAGGKHRNEELGLSHFSSWNSH